MTQSAFLTPLAATLTLLTSCGHDPTGDISIVGTGSARLAGVVVQGVGQAAVPGSRVRLYLPGDHSHSVGQVQTGGGGQFGFAEIPAGTYDLAFSNSGYAASELLGAAATDTGNVYPVIQPPARDPGGVLGAPSLRVTRTDSGQTLTQAARQTFADRLPIRVQTTPESPHQRPLSRVEVSLLQTGTGTQAAGAAFSELRPAGGTVNADPQAQDADSGPLSLGVGSVSGDALLEASATDFNGNRVAQLFAVTVTGGSGGVVATPQSVAALAYTWKGGLEAQVIWSMDTLAGVNGFEVWRSGAAAGPWIRVALAETAACNGSLCSALDTSASLQMGQDYFYRVAAVGRTRAESALGTQPSTHTLPVFVPALVSPAANQSGLPLVPVYLLFAPTRQLGATGAIQTLSVHDDLLSNTTPWTATLQSRTVLGQAGQPADQPDHQVLLLTGGRYVQVYSDLTLAGETNLSGVTFDAQTERLALSHNFDGSGSALQPARRYRYTLGRSAAFRVQDPTRPPGAANPVVAYSVSSDPTGSGSQECPAQPLLPGGPCLEGAPSLEFTTEAGR
ncbi:hypothetical protein [Deinococcus sp.]|uniref:hypothetical protein n=1 Tax=Deinococcus sp. TaxID=47478 RepID=UPI003C7DFA80